MKKLLKNAVVLAIGGVLTKLIGAAYRIPLTNVLGAEGIGIYQMVFPFYCILLTLSSTGIPSGVSKLVAEGRGNILLKSTLIFGSLGLVGSLIMLFGAEAVAALQGNESAAAAYRALSPSVFLVSVISCFRGYYQGKLNNYPTAISQMIEQVIKLAVGLTLCVNLGSTVEEKAALATAAVTVSEIAALAFLLVFKREKRVLNVSVPTRTLVLTVLPVMLASITLPLAKTADSFTALRLLNFDQSTATALYGLYSGVVESVVALPVAVCYALAVSGLPIIAAGKRGAGDGKNVIVYTAILSAALAVVTFVSAYPVIRILYIRLSPSETQIAVNLLRISSLSVVGLSLVQSFSAVLIGKGKLYVSPVCILIGVAIKIAATFILVPAQGVGVYGYAFSDIFCYFVATICFLLYIIRDNFRRKGSQNVKQTDPHRSGRKRRGSLGQRV